MSKPDPIGNIYITSKARMVAEARLKHADLMSQVLMAWYSVCLIAISLLDLSQTFRVRDVSVMTAILSVAVLATSIFIPGQNFGMRAARFRDCYLQLQQIYRSAESDDAKKVAYTDALPQFENHLQRDYEWVLYQSWLFGKPLADADGPVEVTCGIILKSIIRVTLRWSVLASLFVAPVAFGYLLLLPRQV